MTILARLGVGRILLHLIATLGDRSVGFHFEGMIRSIRLSEFNALQVRALRPIGLTDTDRTPLAYWVVGQIGSEYALAHARNRP